MSSNRVSDPVRTGLLPIDTDAAFPAQGSLALLADEPAETTTAEDLGQLHRSVELAKATRSRRRYGWDQVDETVATLLISDVAVAVGVVALLCGRSILLGATFLVSFLSIRAAWGTVRPRLHLSVVEELGAEVGSSASALGAGVVALMLAGDSQLVGRFATMNVVALGVIVALRAITFALLRRRRRQTSGRKRTLIIGAGPVGKNIAEGLFASPEFGLEPIGFLDGSGDAHGGLPVPILSRRTSRLGDLIVQHDVRTVIAAFVADDEDLVDVMLTSTRLDTDILIVPRLYELASDDEKTDWINGVPLVRHTSGVTTRFSWRIKRVVDCTVAVLALLLLSPVLLVAAVGVLIEGGRPVLFRQRRIGVDGVAFELLKFRSMRPADETEQQTKWNVAGDPRIGPVGRFLRRSSIDELPQLLNIVRGEMSLVGPRPERPAFVEQFSAEHSRYWARHRLPVGLTGWAQVNGLRGDTSIAQRARFDNFYIANWSLWLDLKIMLLTVREVLKGSGK